MSPLVAAQSKFLRDAAALITEIHSREGWSCTGGELFRTAEQQAIYLKQGKSKTSASRHLVRQAIDLNIFFEGNLTYRKEDLQQFGTFWESLDPKNRWGGNWKSFIDTPHFERTE